MNRAKLEILTSPPFIIALAILLVNDFILKQTFHNFLTGKLSDFAGLFIFPLFFSAFFPRARKVIFVLTALIFIFWKSPFSQTPIDVWNSLSLLSLGRTVDFSDLLALLILPLSYGYSNAFALRENRLQLSQLKNALTVFIVLISVFAFSATSFEQDRSVDLGSEFVLDTSFDQFQSILRMNPNIKDFSSTKTKIGIPSNMPASDKDSDFNSFSSFQLEVPYCGSKRITVYAYLRIENDKPTVERVSMNYWCNNPPTETDRYALLNIFEREIISKIEQNDTQ